MGNPTLAAASKNTSIAFTPMMNYAFPEHNRHLLEQFLGGILDETRLGHQG